MQVYTAVSLLHPLDHPAECKMPTPMPLDNLLGAIFIGIVLSTVYVYSDCSGGRLGANRPIVPSTACMVYPAFKHIYTTHSTARTIASV